MDLASRRKYTRWCDIDSIAKGGIRLLFKIRNEVIIKSGDSQIQGRVLASNTELEISMISGMPRATVRLLLGLRIGTGGCSVVELLTSAQARWLPLIWRA